MARKRKLDPTIPAHIDQAQLPSGLYWDKSGKGRWYVRALGDDGKVKCKTVAGATAKLSELHGIVERAGEPDRGSIDALMLLFEKSPAYLELADNTRRSYRLSRLRISDFKLKTGSTFGKLEIERLSPPVIQRFIDRIAVDRPTTAVHTLQYLRRVLRWGVNRGHCKNNPARGIEAPSLKPKRRLPSNEVHQALLEYARERGGRLAHTEGSVAPYLWVCMELAYLCHLRGIELLRMRESQGESDALLADRSKGSRSTRFNWTPRLKAAWDAAIGLRNTAWAAKRKPTPLRREDRAVIVGQNGDTLTRSALDSAWQRLIHAAIEDQVIEADQRFGLHDLKRKGITERGGTRAEKQTASGHRSAQMMDVYDLSVPRVNPTNIE